MRRHRLTADLSVEELAARVDVSADWLARLEAGAAEDMTYRFLLGLVRASQP